MSAYDIWESFRKKLIEDSLCDEDFTDEMRPFLKAFLSGIESLPRRTKYYSAPAQYFDMETKASIMLNCSDDNYRFDFIKKDKGYALAFIECITLPVSDISTLPYDKFQPLPEKETFIKREKEISKTIWYFNKFKELLGREEAIKIFMDGNGENIGARSWVPFYSERLSYIAYAAWIEERINGENVVIKQFSDKESVICFKDHIWRKMYNMTSHLKTRLNITNTCGFLKRYGVTEHERMVV